MEEAESVARSTRRLLPVRLAGTSGRAFIPAAIVVALVAAVGSYAYFTNTGAGSGTPASSGLLGAPTGVAGSVTGSTVSVTWNAPTGVTAPPQGYYVQRYLGSIPSAACGTSLTSLTAPSSVTSCSDTGVGAGTYTYTVTAVYNSWSATSTASSSVTVLGVASQLVFTTSPQTLTAGVLSGTITVQRQDASNNPVTTGSLVVSLSKSSTGGVLLDPTGTNVITGITIASGSSSASFTYRDTAAGSPTITATSSLPTVTQQETVNPAAANKLVFTTAPVGNVSEGSNFTTSPAVSVEDTFGNVVKTDSGSVTLGISTYSAGTSGGMTQGSITCSSTLTVATVLGVATFTNCQISGSAAGGTYTLSATRSPLTSATSGNVTINAGVANAAQSTLTPTSASITANGTATQVLTVQAKDANGNNLATGGATVTITKSSGTGTIGAVTDNHNGTYTATVTSPSATGSGVFVATLNSSQVQSGTGSQTQATLTYTPGAASGAKSTLTPTSASITANGVATAVLTVQAEDASGNNLTTGGATVTITKSSGTGTISSVTDNGTGTYTAIVTSPTAAGSGVFVATIGGSNVQSGGGSQTQATVTYTAGGSAIAFVQDAVAGSEAPGTETPTLSSPPTNGHVLIVLVGDDGSSSADVSTVSGGGVTTWNKVTSALGTASPNPGEAEIWYGYVTCAPCSSSNEAVTVTMSHSTNVQLANVSEWSGIASSNPVDNSTSAPGTASGSTFTSGPITLSQTGDLIVSDAWVASGFGYPKTGCGNVDTDACEDASSPYTALLETDAGGTFYRGWAAYQVDSSSSPVSATWTEDGSGGAYATGIAAFKSSAVADTTPPTGSITAPAANAYVGGSAVAVNSNSADTGSGVASAQFEYTTHGGSSWTTIGTDTTGPYSVSWNTSGLSAGQYDLRVITTDNASNTFTSPVVTVTVDNTPPTGSISYTNGYNTSGTVSVPFTATDSGSGVNAASGQLKRASATLSNGTCGNFGAFSNIGSAGVASPYSDSSVSTNTCYQYDYVVSDNVGNQATITSTSEVKVDTTAPTNSLTLTSQNGGDSYLSGNTIYYQGSSAGSFEIKDTVADSGSGPASSQFASLAGTATGWTFTGSTVSSPTNGPYVSGAFGWPGGTTSSPTEVVTGADAAGNATAAPTLTFTNDSAAPTGSVSYMNGYNTTGTVSVSFSATDGGSGVNASTGQLLRASATLSSANEIAPGTCGTFSSYSNIGSAGVSSPYSDTTAATGHCYEYEYVVSDNVGNQATVTSASIVQVDTTAPSAPTPTLSAATGNSYINGTTVYTNPQTGFSGGFTVTSSPTDADSGIMNVIFPSLTGFTGGGGADSSSPYTTTYAWSGSGATASGAKTITATNYAGLTSTATFTVTPDTTPPSGAALTVNGTTASTAGTSSDSSNTTFTIGARTNYGDSGSGLASSTLTVGSEALSNNTCGAAAGPFSTPTTISGTTQPGGIVTGYCYLYTLTGIDNVGNVAAISTTVKVDTSSPSAPTLSFSAFTNAYWPSTGTTVYFKAGSPGGFTLTPSSTEPASGIASYSYPSLGSGWSNTNGAYTFTGSAATASGSVAATNNAGTTGAGTSFTAQADGTAPTGGAFSANSTAATTGGSASTITSGTTLTINSRTDYSETQSATQSGLASSTLTIQSATLSNGNCGTYGSPTTITGTTSQTVASGNCYLLTLAGTDNVGNSASISTTVTVDTTPPTTPTLLFSNVANAVYSNSFNTLYFRPAAGGSYTVTASSTDPDGIKPGNAGYTFSSLAANNFTGTQTAGQEAYTFGGTATPPGVAPTVFSTNNAGVNSSNATYNVVEDTTAPTGGAFHANGTAATTGGSSSYLTSGTTLTINSRTDYSETQSASQSGLAGSVLTIQAATLSNNTCGTFGTATTITGTTSQTVASGHCYLLTLTGTDNVGNAASISTTVLADISAPSAPTPTLSAATGNSYINGATVYTNPQTGFSGGFTVTSSPTDAISGIENVIFPSLTGFTSGGGTDSTSPYSTTYAWSGAAGASGSQTITDTNNAGLTNTSAFTVTPDTTAPSGGAFTANGVTATAAGALTYFTSGTSVTWAGRTDYTDTGSGLKSSTLTYETATLSNDACGTYGAGTTLTGTAGTVTVTNGDCYLFTLTGIDNVGNVAAISVTVMVDKTAPSAPTPTLSAATGNTYYPGSGTTVYINPQTGKSGGFTVTSSPTDSISGIKNVIFPALTGFTSGSNGGTDTTSPYTTTYAWSGAAGASGSQTITDTSNAGLTNTATFTVTPDTTAPSGGALTVNGTSANSAGTSSYSKTGSFTISAITDYTDSGSGLASSTLTVQTATLSSTNGIANGTCGTYGAATTITSRSTPISETETGPTCYLYTLTGIDNVGNTATISTTVMVDTTAPSAPTPTLFAATGSTYVSGTTVYINPQSGKSGGFTVTATPTDNDTGIENVIFPALTGFTSGSNGGTDTTSPFSTTYAWSGAAGASGSQTITDTNNTGLTNTSAFTVTPDTTAPSGGALTVNGTAASSSGTSSTTTSTSFTIGARTDYTDGGSGLASSTLTIQSETLTGSTCGAAGSGGPYTTATTITGTTNPSITTGYCYLYKLTGTDNVGNTASITATVTVEPYSGSSTTDLTFSDQYGEVNGTAALSPTSTANTLAAGGETLTGMTFNVSSSSGSRTWTGTVGIVSGGTWTATALTCTIAENASSCTVTGNVTIPAGDSINIQVVQATGTAGSRTGSWTVNYT